ncbi:unnamed protein product [Amoebophrya sp. A120]|nr:unnamed protein product [Amoebophrya sp. A120]|eukprot:GSA120T00002575001.1
MGCANRKAEKHYAYDGVHPPGVGRSKADARKDDPADQKTQWARIRERAAARTNLEETHKNETPGGSGSATKGARAAAAASRETLYRLPSCPRAEDILTHVCWVDGDSFVTAGINGGCYLYNLETRKERNFQAAINRACTKVYPLSCPDAGGARTVGPDSSGSDVDRLLTCGADGCVKLWDLGKLRPTTLTQHRMTVNDAAVRGRGGGQNWKVLSGSRDAVLNLSDVATQQVLHTKKVLRNVITRVLYVPEQDVFVQLSEDLQLRVWSPALELLHSVHAGPNQFVSGAAVGAEVVCGSKGFSSETVELLVFDLRTMSIRKRVAGVATQNVDCVDVVRGGSTAEDVGAAPAYQIVAGSKDGTLKVFDDNLKCVSTLRIDQPSPITSCSVRGGLCLATSFGPRISCYDLKNSVAVAESPILA